MNPNQNNDQPPAAGGSAGGPGPAPRQTDGIFAPSPGGQPTVIKPNNTPTTGGGTLNPTGIYPNPLQGNLKNSPPSAPSGKKERGKGIRSALGTILLFILAPAIALSITAYGFQSYQVDGQSMETTLQNNDRLIVDKVPRTVSRVTHHQYVPKRGQIIIFNQAGLFDAGNSTEKQLIKRVIGLPGERVVISSGTITVYNSAHRNGFDPDKTGQYVITAPTTPGDVDVTLKSNEIFVCGDNRTNSEDSRYFGPVDVKKIVGKLSVRILPIGKAKKF